MLGRAMVAAGLGGVLGAHRLADLPDSGTLALASALPGLAIWTARRARPARIAGLLRGLAWCLLAAWAGFVFAVSCAQVRLDQTLADGNVDRVSRDRKSTRLNSSHVKTSYAVFCLNKKK